MTEAEWLAAEQFDDAMSSAAIDSPTWSFRKETLFSVACCQRVLSLLPHERGAQLLAEFESAALAPATTPPVDFTRPLGDYVAAALYDPKGENYLVLYALGAVARGYISQVAESCGVAIASTGAEWAVLPTPEECRVQAAIIRDIVGNPFRPVAFAPEWRTDTVTALASQMYDSRDFSAMPILADAFQDAGCDNDDILAHCRNPEQVHVRGCWVIDLALGKK